MTGDRRRILVLERRRRDALLASDAVALRELVASNCVYVHSSGFIDTGAAVVARVADGSVVYESIEAASQSVTTFPACSVVTYVQTSSVRFDDASHTSEARCVAVWSEGDSGTQLVIFQSVPLRSVGAS